MRSRPIGRFLRIADSHRGNIHNISDFIPRDEQVDRFPDPQEDRSHKLSPADFPMA